MKTRIIKSLLTFIMAVVALPMLSQDFMNIHFKNGTLKTFHFNTLVEFYTSPYDGDGMIHMDNQFQHVKTIYEELVFDINKIDSISFTKYDEDKVQKSMSDAMNSILPKLSDCSSANDALSKIDIIKQSKGVETAWVEGGALFVKIKDWDTIIFEFNNTPKTNANGANYASRKMKALNASPHKLKKPDGSPYKAVIANQQHYDVSEWRSDQRNDYMYPLKDNLEKAGFETDYFPDNEREVDLDFFFNDIFDYDVILLSTHGGYSPSTGHRIVSGMSFGKIQKRDLPEGRTAYDEIIAAFNKDFLNIFNDSRFSQSQGDLKLTFSEEDRIENGEYHTYWVSYVGIYESFFSHTVKRNFSNSNSLFFNAACESLMDNHSFANLLIDQRKLGTYVGYNQSNFYGQETGCTMLTNMLNGLSAEKTYNDLGAYELGNINKEIHDVWKENTIIYKQDVTGTYKDEDYVKYQYDENQREYVEIKNYTASLELVPDNSNIFIVPTNTNPIDQTKANNEYNQTETVIVYGLRTGIPTSSSLRCGFKLYSNENVFGQTSPWGLNVIGDINGEFLSSEQNKFMGKLTGLERGKEYSYQAYTFDGEHFNFGKSCKLKIDYPALTLSTKSITLPVLTCGAVEITAGSGEYGVNNKNGDKVKATLQGTTIAIEALAVGNAKIVVTDIKTNKEETIEVTVTQGLQLSTTKLSIVEGNSSTVSITAGSGEYGVTNLNSDIAKATLSGTTITIQALAVGDAKVVVTDVKTGQKKIIEVTVTKKAADLQLSTTKLSLVEGNSGTVSITAGSGEYGVTNLNSDIAKATLNGTTITIQALAVGDAKVVVTDVKSGQTKIIEVTVTPKTVTSDIALSTQEVYLNVGETKQIEVTAGSGHYSVWIYAPEVADVTVNGNIITIKGLSSGKTIVKVTDTTTNKTIPFGIEVKGPSVNDKDAVDLGLSVKWAKMNVGAVSEEDCGEHYAWGETESKSYFSWSSYDFCNGTESTISKYNNVDGKTMLDPSNDAAHVIMGGNWRTPTLTEMEELVNRCKWTVETLNGVKGARVTGPNGNSIFLPFGGQMFEDQLSHYDNSGYYYASTLSSNGEKYAPALCCFGSGNKQEFVHYARYYGLSIRGVLSK